jgi:hypothetical protein
MWEERIQRLTELKDSNEAIVNSLDIIDEILEEGGILSVFTNACIPVPHPHRTWNERKQSARAQTICSNINPRSCAECANGETILNVPISHP